VDTVDTVEEEEADRAAAAAAAAVEDNSVVEEGSVVVLEGSAVVLEVRTADQHWKGQQLGYARLVGVLAKSRCCSPSLHQR
jgi:hypothetical protein